MAFDKKILGKKPVLFLGGMFLVILGITLVLVWWKDVVGVFRGCVGISLALGGMLILSQAGAKD